jgi:mRNA interferase MazF
VVQNDYLNRGNIRTVIVCALTSNLRRAADPGNMLLHPGEANLPQQSVVNASQLYTVPKHSLGEQIGTLSRQRLEQVITGIHRVLEPRDLPDDELGKE